MKLFELIENLEALKKYGDCDVEVEDGAVSFSQDGVTTRIVCDEKSKYAIGNCDKKEMTFGEAIEAMKSGRKVARKGWNGKGMYVWLMPGSTVKDCKNIVDPHLANIDKAEGEIRFLDSIRMRTADGSVLTGWLASQTDILSEDWTIVE